MAFTTDSSLNNVTQTLINVTGTAGGTSIPPKQFGEFRIPFVKNLRVGPKMDFLGGTQYTLLWDEPDNTTNVSHFNIYITGLLSDNSTPLGPYSSQSSPASLRVVASNAAVLTFFVQTQLNNGNVSELDRSPSCTSQVAPPTITGGPGGTGISPSAITPGSLNQIMCTDGSATTSLWRSLVSSANIVPQFSFSTFQVNLADVVKTKAYAENMGAISGSYSCANDDSTILVDASGGGVSILLPTAPLDGQTLTFKKTDVSGNTVSFTAGVTPIETGANFSNSRGCVVLRFTTGGTSGWYIISKY